MPAAEVKVTINGPTPVTFNSYAIDDTPAYLLRNTAELLSPPEPRQTRSERQGEHGVHASLAFYGERVLAFSGEIIGESQADRKAKENDLRACLVLSALQSYAGDDGFRLVEITDEDGVLKQCYAVIASRLTFG